MRRSKTEPEFKNAKRKLQTRRSNSFHGKENSFHWKTLSREELYLIWENFISRSSFNEVCYQEVSDLKDNN